MWVEKYKKHENVNVLVFNYALLHHWVLESGGNAPRIGQLCAPTALPLAVKPTGKETR